MSVLLICLVTLAYLLCGTIVLMLSILAYNKEWARMIKTSYDGETDVFWVGLLLVIWPLNAICLPVVAFVRCIVWAIDSIVKMRLSKET